LSRVFIVTGARKGIGRHLAEHYLAQGHIVAGCSRQDSSLTHERYHHYPLDVADEKAVIAMVRDVARRHGTIDVVLNNAGVAAMNHLLATPLAGVQATFATNFVGSFLFLREAAKVMVRKRSGCIVNFSTVAVPMRLEGEAAYAASKAALVSLTEIAARELAPFGIRVNAVGPTPVLTDLIRTVPKEKIDGLLARQAIPRLGELDDVANVVDFFVSERSRFITGQTLYLGGVVG
jgi:3-oxoacyl-[acyl-carrier protein] reductase